MCRLAPHRGVRRRRSQRSPRRASTATAGKEAKTRSSTVVLPNGTKRLFERKAGGNPDCPVKCTKDHAKGAWCHLDHVDK